MIAIVATCRNEPNLKARDVELPTDCASGELRNLTVPGDRGPSTVGRILPDRVRRTFARQYASVLSQMPDQILALHETTTPAGTRSTLVLA